MAKTRTVQKYTDKAIERAGTMSKEEYHRIKHMPKIELVHYLDRLYAAAYKSGYEKGVEDGKQQAVNAAVPAATPDEAK